MVCTVIILVTLILLFSLSMYNDFLSPPEGCFLLADDLETQTDALRNTPADTQESKKICLNICLASGCVLLPLKKEQKF